jgi:hypothetical protein
MSLEVDKEKIMDLFNAIDYSNERSLTKKELKLVCRQMVGLGDVDLERARRQREEWKVKHEKEMKKEISVGYGYVKIVFLTFNRTV